MMYDPKLSRAEAVALREPLDIPHHDACVEQYEKGGVDCICAEIEREAANEANERKHDEGN